MFITTGTIINFLIYFDLKSLPFYVSITLALSPYFSKLLFVNNFSLYIYLSASTSHYGTNYFLCSFRYIPLNHIGSLKYYIVIYFIFLEYQTILFAIFSSFYTR